LWLGTDFPFSFNVLARLPLGQRLLATQGKRRVEYEGAPPVLDPRFVQRRIDRGAELLKTFMKEVEDEASAISSTD